MHRALDTDQEEKLLLLNAPANVIKGYNNFLVVRDYKFLRVDCFLERRTFGIAKQGLRKSLHLNTSHRHVREDTR